MSVAEVAISSGSLIVCLSRLPGITFVELPDELCPEERSLECLYRLWKGTLHSGIGLRVSAARRGVEYIVVIGQPSGGDHRTALLQGVKDAAWGHGFDWVGGTTVYDPLNRIRISGGPNSFGQELLPELEEPVREYFTVRAAELRGG